MRILLFLVAVAVAKARFIEKCSGIEVHGLNHEKEVLKTGLDSPYQLAIDYDTNYLFFSYSTSSDPLDEFKSAFINLKTNEFGTIAGISGGFANAVDSKKHVVYLGGNSGIYKFNFNTRTAVFAGARDRSIWQLYFKDKLYYTDYPMENAYTFEDGVSKKVPELENTNAMLVALDTNDNIFFSNSSGLFCYKKDKSQIFELGDYNVNGFTNDMNNNVFFSTPDGLFTIDKNAQEVTQLADIENVYGIAIEADDNIIYADQESIVRLKPTKQKCISDNGNRL